MIRKAEPMDSFEYVQSVLDAYRVTPGTCGVARRADRVFALELFERGVALEAVRNALVSCRRPAYATFSRFPAVERDSISCLLFPCHERGSAFAS